MRQILKLHILKQQDIIAIIKAVIKTCDTAVKFIPYGTLCPVCLLAGIESQVITNTSEGEIRYCTCQNCGARIKAVGDLPEPRQKRQQEPDKQEKQKSKKSKKRK